MRTLALLTLLSLTAFAEGRFERFCSRGDTGRSDRGFLCGSTFFEAFNGVGTTTPCSTTAPTGSKGEVLTFARASSGVCTKTATGGLTSSGIANGDLVLLSNDQSRVEYSGGVLGLLVEGQGVNLLPRFDALTNALWSDVGTPAVVDGATDPFGATTGDTITDDDPAAFEGRSQPVTVVAASAQYAYCYVKAGTLSKARISLDGTAATITGLSATTWSIIEVLDASASGVSISFQVTNGNVVGDTGTVIWGGCDVKAASYRTSIVPTAGATATRITEAAGFDLGASAPGGDTGSMAVTIERTWSVTGVTSPIALAANKVSFADLSGIGMWAYSAATSGATFRCLSGNDAAGLFTTSLVAPVGNRIWCASSGTGGTTTGAFGTSMTASAATSGTFSAARYLGVGGYPAGVQDDSIHTLICRDSNSARCR